MSDMPKVSTYRVLLILGFLLGIIWGALSYKPYKNLKAAVEAGDVNEAQANAKKIRIFVIIGIVVNVFAFIGQMNG